MGTCARIIWAGAKIWSGEGYAPGAPIDMYSGLAKAYGIYTVLSFLLQYMQYYPLLLLRQQCIQVYCNNKSLIEHICNRTAIQCPHRTIQDDYPIYAEIEPCIQQLKLLELWFIHVRGHQDKKLNQPLTLPECLNIDCDA